MVDVGAVVAGYRLVKAVGSGPFGLVYRGEDARGRPLAIKFLKPGFLARADGAAAYGRLGGSTAVHSQLAHPYLARVYGTVADRQQNAFGQFGEFLEGVPLTRAPMDPRVLRGHDPRGLATLLTWYEQLGDVLTWLHAQGMVHGNLKPTNVLLVSLATERHVKLLDLSWSAIGVAAVSRGPNSYVSPEQYEGAVPDHLSDQWSMATILERTFTGGQHRLSLGVLPAALVQTVQRATQIDPQRRFRGMTELVEALREIRMDLQLSVGASAEQEQHGASTLPAGEIPSDLAKGYPRGAAGVSLPVENEPKTTLDETRPVAAGSGRGAEEWRSSQKTLPYINREDLHRPGLSPVPQIPRIVDEDGSVNAPLVRHSVDDILDEGLTEETEPVRSPDVAVRRQEIADGVEPEFDRKRPRVSSASRGGDGYHPSPRTFRGSGSPAVGHRASQGGPVVANPGRVGSAQAYSDRPDQRFGSEDGSWKQEEHRAPYTGIPIERAPRAGPVDAAPSPKWMSYLAVMMVFVGALLVGAWSLSQASWPLYPLSKEDVVITTKVVNAEDDAQSPPVLSNTQSPVTAAPQLVPTTKKTASPPVKQPERRRRRSPIPVRRRSSPVPATPDSDPDSKKATVVGKAQGAETAQPRRRTVRPSVGTSSKSTAIVSPSVAAVSPAISTEVVASAAVESREVTTPAMSEPQGDLEGGAATGARGVESPDAQLVATPLATSNVGVGGGAKEGSRPLESVDYASECGNGQPDACMTLGRQKALTRRLTEAASAYAEACFLGRGDGCMLAAQLFTRRRQAPRARQMFLAACKAQMAEGCHQASIRTVGSRSRVLKVRACSLGRKASCETQSSTTSASLK
ncbi:MAG: protein kinase [Myxococcales bacterium]|nr:protein kinase [Myxococcales bacterium]